MAAEVEGAEAAQPAASAEKKKKAAAAAAAGSRGKASFLATAWLILYNTVMTAGWLVLAVSMARYGLAKGSNRGLYRSIEKTLKIFQTGALLEVVHCATGIVPSSAVLTAFQVSSRVFLVWAVTDSVKPVQNEYSVLIYLSAWTLTEIVRYSFYTFSLLKYLPRAIKWARYTLFIVLYPLGVTGELLTIYHALPHVYRSKLFAYPLPNALNISFDYYYFLIIVMISYMPIFPQLYFHMMSQRKKVLGEPKAKES
ncbi:very-long-chain (3R)-3-hydroxyacyl-CoA dehydratase 1-like [Lampetra fluviatilis]